MLDLGEACFYLGIALECGRSTHTIRLSQTALIGCVIHQFDLKDAVPVSTPMESSLHLSCCTHAPSNDAQRELMSHTPYRSLIGSLMYLAIGTRPDIAHAIQQLCCHLDCYGPIHWDAAKHVVRHLKGSQDLHLVLGGDHPAHLMGYTNSDYANCPDTRRSVSGYCFTLGLGMVTWSACQQKTVSLSTCKAEYVTASDAAKELAWICTLLCEIDFIQPSTTPLLRDNTGGITLSEDASYHSKVKHINVNIHSISKRVALSQLTLHYVRSLNNSANIFTKALPHKDFEHLRVSLGLQ